VSALRPPFLRVTVKELGDHSRGLAHIEPGTRIAVEGPYGAFTARRRAGDAVLLVGAGVGSTPLPGLLDDLPPGADVVAILRARTAGELVLRDEIASRVAARGGRLHELVGPREHVRLDAEALRALVPDLAARDLYVCGPEGFAGALAATAHAAGVPRARIHREEFAF
jgi:ferredoxin-NADP reductase